MLSFKELIKINDLSDDALLLLEKNVLLFDIETTGFSADKTSLYLIGCCYKRENSVVFEQFFAQSKNDEPEMIDAFSSLISTLHAPILCSFNGDGFDLPYLKKKCEKNNIPSDFLNNETLDLYSEFVCLKNLLGLSNFKQKTVEAFLQTGREDPFNGGELIEVYRNYRKNPDEQALHSLLLHNKEDVLGILSLTGLRHYKDLWDGSYEINFAEIKSRRDFDQNLIEEFVVDLLLPSQVPVPLNTRNNGAQLAIREKHVLMSIPIANHRLHFYFENYKDYWYYPAEDLAVHKVLATFSEKSDRVKASPETACQHVEPEQFEAYSLSQKKQFITNQIHHFFA